MTIFVPQSVPPMPSLSIAYSIAIDTSKPDSSVCNLLRPQSSIVTVGLFDDILQEAGIRFRGIGGWPAALFMSPYLFLCVSPLSSPLGKYSLESIAGVFDCSILGVFGEELGDVVVCQGFAGRHAGGLGSLCWEQVMRKSAS